MCKKRDGLLVFLLFSVVFLMPVVSNAAVDPGVSRLLSKNIKVITQRFMVKKEVSLPEVKVNLQLRMTVTPEKAGTLTKTLKTLKMPNGKRLSVTGVQQTLSNTGMVNLTAQVEGHLPVGDLSVVTALIKSYNKSGQRLTLIQTSPYFPESLRQKVKNELSVALYHQAQVFLHEMNRIAKPVHYSIGAVTFTQSSQGAPVPMVKRSYVMMADASGGNSALQMQRLVQLYAEVVYTGMTDRQGKK